MARTFADLIGCPGRETTFPSGEILLTGTGDVPPDDFILALGGLVHIDLTAIGRLTNVVGVRA